MAACMARMLSRVRLRSRDVVCREVPIRMLEVQSASVSRNGKRIFSGLTLSVSPGELIAVVGENGCGKSTLGRVLCGARLVDDGTYSADGHDPSSGPDERLLVRALVGRVCQDPMSQIVSSSVYDEVAFGPRNLGLIESAVRDRVVSALDAVGMSSYGGRATSQLSGGELQRIAIAGVLAMAPRYLVLDEPTAQLDPRMRGEFRSLFLQLAHEVGMGVVLITHDRREVDLADRVINLCHEPTVSCLRPQDSNMRSPVHEDDRSEPTRQVGLATSPVLSLNGVVYSYGDEAVLRGVSLSIHAGEVVMLTGASGAGKSTLGLIASGMLSPDAGEVRLEGKAPAPGGVGLAFQRPEDQFFLDTVFDEVAFGLRNLGRGDDEVDRNVRQALSDVGLDEELLDMSPFELSGGQARRVALASVLALDAPAYILDEPTAALDESGRAFVHRLVRRMARRGHAVLVITHDIEEWRPFATRELRLRRGVVACCEARGGELEQGTLEIDGKHANQPDGCDGAFADEHGSPGPACESSPRKPKAVRGALFGYVPGSCAARVDARVKMALLLLFTIGVFVADDPLLLGGWFMILCACLSCAHMGIGSVLRGLKPACLLLAFTFVANALSLGGEASVGVLGPIGVDLEGGLRGLLAIGRIALTVGFSLAVASSTTGTQLSDGCVRILGPLARFGAPVGAIGTTLSLTLRFIPLVSDEIHRIKTAQAARGVRFDAGPLFNRIRAWASILTPLIVGLLRRADLLAEAMSGRCYDAFSAGLRPAPKPLAALDFATLAVGILLFGGLLVMSLQGDLLW